MGFCGDLLQFSLSLGSGLLDLHCAGLLAVFFVCCCVAISRINFVKKHHSMCLFGSAYLTPSPVFCFHSLCLCRVVAEVSQDTVD